jgi:hypothetical protein
MRGCESGDVVASSDPRIEYDRGYCRPEPSWCRQLGRATCVEQTRIRSPVDYVCGVSVPDSYLHPLFLSQPQEDPNREQNRV